MCDVFLSSQCNCRIPPKLLPRLRNYCTSSISLVADRWGLQGGRSSAA
jgi:hypothetical protein